MKVSNERKHTFGKKIEHTKRPKRSTSNRVWDQARIVLGQPPHKMIIMCPAGQGTTTRWLIQINDNTEIDLMGNQAQVVAQMEDMV